MSIKGSWSRVRDRDAYAKTLDRILRNERRKQKQKETVWKPTDIWNKLWQGAVINRKGDPLL